MKFDISKMEPSEWIAHIRSKHGLTTDRKYHVTDEFIDDLLSHLPDEDRGKAREVWTSRQGRPAYKIFDELMETYKLQIEPVLQPEEHKLFSDTYFAVLPTCEFNGYAGFTPRGDRVIILHEALGYTLSYWSYWFLRYFEEGFNYLSADTTRLADTCRHIKSVWNGWPPQTGLPDIYPHKKDSWELSETMTFSAISFVLGHELGHILHNPEYVNENETRI